MNIAFNQNLHQSLNCRTNEHAHRTYIGKFKENTARLECGINNTQYKKKAAQIGESGAALAKNTSNYEYTVSSKKLQPIGVFESYQKPSRVNRRKEPSWSKKGGNQ